MEHTICTVNPYDHLQIVSNPDGSITRLVQWPTTPAAATPHPDPSSPVLVKDVQLNPHHRTWLRIFFPRHHHQHPEKHSSSSSAAAEAVPKLPLIVYFHGGGFILLSAGTTEFHNFCSAMALHLASAVVSVEYRLAPEHRLPAAYDDAVEALHWIKRADDEWLRESADVSNCFLMGSSAGGNIAYEVGLRAAAMAGEFEPLRIRGLVLHQPFFGGSKRTESEIRLADDSVLPLSVADLMWELSLPAGADRDHEYCNPVLAGRGGGGWDRFGKLKEMGCGVLVIGGGGDPLIDRQKAAAKIIQEAGVAVEAVLTESNGHAAEIFDPAEAKALFDVTKKFMG